MSLTISQARDDLLSKLGVENSALATALMLQDVVIALNGALQTLQTAGQDYFTRQVLTGTFLAGSSFITLPASAQAVIGPVRITSGPNAGQALSALQSRGEADQFARIYGNDTAWGSGSLAEPIAYWIENLRNTNVGGDINQINVRPCPVPPYSRTFEIEVVNDAPSYAIADLSSGTTQIPVAQNYAESILLPLARLNITRSSQFARPELLAQITADAQTALAKLGLAGGFPVEETPEPPRATKG